MNILSSMVNNEIVWIIVAFALPCYSLMLELILATEKNDAWFERSHSWIDSLQTAVGVLPLLGLLGTISGLLSTFDLLSISSVSQQELMSGGIADALFTTEIGLVMAIPGWLMLTWLKAHMQAWELRQCAPV